MTLTWYHYPYGDTYEEEKDGDKNPVAIPIEAAGGDAKLVIPEDAKSGDTIHVILEGQDSNGIRAYQRVNVMVK